MSTSYSDKTSILSDLWVNYRDDMEFDDFISYNDLGLPLAYAISEGIVESTERAENFIEETYSLLLEALDLNEDIAYDAETIDDLLEMSEREI